MSQAAALHAAAAATSDVAVAPALASGPFPAAANRDEHAVDLSLLTASLAITPIVVTLLGLGRKALLQSLQRAAEFDEPPAYTR
jgi:hypothetical protein